MGQIGPFNFSGGLISRSSVFASPPNSLYVSNNFRSYYGSILENFGTKNINSSALGTGVGFCCGITPANNSSSGSKSMVCVFDEKIYLVDVSGSATDISGAAQFSATSQRQVTADILNGIMVIGDPNGSTGWLAQWSGTGNCSKLTAALDGRCVLTVNNFMFVAYIDSAPSTFQWSAVTDPTTWPSGNSLDFRKGDGDKIVALSYIGTDLYIFKQFSIGRLTTTTTTISGAVTLGPLQTVSIGIGAAGTRAVDRLPDGRLVFWAMNGHAYIFDGSTLTDISDQPFPEPSVQDLFVPIQPDVSVCSVSVYPPRSEVHFMTAVQSGSPLGRDMVYNYQTNQWSDFEPNSVGGTPPASPLEFSNSLFVPTISGKVASSSASFPFAGCLVSGTYINGYLYVNDAPGSTDNFVSQWNMSLLLNGDGRNFIPRSLLMFYKSATSSTPTMTVSYGYDNAAMTNSVTVTTSSSYQRLRMNLVEPSPSFSTIQIQVQGQSGLHGILVEPFYLSDEVMI